jgi:hypothetical protein
MRIVKSIFSSIFSTMFSTISFAKFSVILPALLIAGFLSSLSFAATANRTSDALTNEQTVALRGNAHRKAQSQFDQGPVYPAMSLGTITRITLPTDPGLSQDGDTGEADLNFTFTSAVSSYQVAQGSPVDATFTVAMNDGFTGPVSFACTDPAPASKCTVPNPIGATGIVSFNITTSLPTTASLQHSDRGVPMFYAALLPGLLGILFTAGSAGRSRRFSLRGMRFLGMVLILGFSTLWLASCGGSSGGNNNPNPGTTPGTYMITVTATSGTTTVPLTFNLVVQP